MRSNAHANCCDAKFPRQTICGCFNIDATADYILGLEGKRRVVNLLPYHNIAGNKHEKMGRHGEFKEFSKPNQDTLNRIIEQFRNKGIKASVGG